MRDPGNAHWRDSARRPKLFVVDAYAAFPLLFFLLHIRWWTFFCAVGAISFFALIEKFGFTIPVFRRWLRSFLAGPYREARPWFYFKRRY